MKTKNQILSITAILLIAIGISTTFLGCKKEKELTKTNLFTNTTEVMANVSGQVFDENGIPLAGASVSIGNNVFTTASNGVFFFQNITTKEKATLITVQKPGYFKGYRTMSILKNKDNFTKIRVLQKNNAQSFTTNTDAVIVASGGAKVEITKNSIMNASSGAAYNGVVQIFAKTIDALDANIAELTPGALRGINAMGEENALATYGMIAVEMYDASGNALQIATGKSAKIRMPIALNQLAIAPTEIALWHFDEGKAMWVEDGKAIKTGSEYIGTVSHFSYWNCDYGGPICQFDATFLDSATNNPLTNLKVELVTNSAIAGTRSSWTNASGTASGGIPTNTTYTLHLIDACGNIFYTTTFNTTTAAISLGNILVNVPITSVATMSGNVVDCSSNILPNAPVVITNGSNSVIVFANALGVFNYFTILCTSPTPFTFTAYDPATFISGTGTASIITGANAIGTVAACGTVNEFINYTLTDAAGTNSYSYLAPNNNFNTIYNSPNTSIACADSQNTVGYNSINFSFDGAGTMGSHNLVSLTHYHSSAGISTYITSGAISLPINITQYGATSGTFMGGNFSGSFTTVSPANSYTVSGSFATKRDF
jgi:hypothetical protein